MNIITRIFVTGTEGYLGSLLAPELMRQGYEVIGLDTGFYKERRFYRDGGTTPLTLATVRTLGEQPERLAVWAGPVHYGQCPARTRGQVDQVQVGRQVVDEHPAAVGGEQQVVVAGAAAPLLGRVQTPVGVAVGPGDQGLPGGEQL